jgi:hypothetical protein
MQKKIQIFHFVNLVGWEDLLMIMKEVPIKKNYSQTFYCDTLSLKILSYFFGKNIFRFNGPTALKKVKKKSDIQYLVAKPMSFSATVLPNLSKKELFEKFINSFVIEKSNIIIGISSPKQNFLALEIAKKNHINTNVKIWCLGAAIYNQNNLALSRLRLLSFFLSDPLRVIKKVFLTVKEIFRIILFKKKHFKEFCSYIEKCNKMKN